MNSYRHSMALLAAFVIGGIFFTNVNVKPVKAQSTGLSGSCYTLGTSPSFGYKTTTGSKFHAAWMGLMNFDTKTESAVKLVATATNGDPNYSTEPVQTGSFTVSDGPITGTYKINYSQSDYLIVIPVNSGNTYLIFDPSGSTGVCQKV